MSELPPPSLAVVAERVGANERAVRHRLPAEAAAVIAANARYRRQDSDARYAHTVESYEAAAINLILRGIKVCRKNLEIEAGIPAFSRNVSRTQAVKEVVGRYSVPRRPQSPAWENIGQAFGRTGSSRNASSAWDETFQLTWIFEREPERLKICGLDSEESRVRFPALLFRHCFSLSFFRHLLSFRPSYAGIDKLLVEGFKRKLEARAGVEPAWKDLQSSA